MRHQIVTSRDAPVHIKGQAWQSYLLFGQSGTLAVIDSKGSYEPVVTRVSGATITAKGVDGNGAIDISIQSTNAIIMVVSYRSFTLSAG